MRAKKKSIYLFCLILIVCLSVFTVPVMSLPDNGQASQPLSALSSAVSVPLDADTSNPSASQSDSPVLSGSSDLSTQKDKDTVTIRFSPGRGTGAVQKLTLDVGTSFSVPACTFTPPPGKRFQYWSTPIGNFQENDTLIIPKFAGAMTFTATWEDILSVPESNLSIYFNANGGTGTMSPMPTVNGSFTVPACTFTPPTGKRFLCWSTPIGNFQAGDILNGLENFTDALIFTAQWENTGGQQSIILTPGQTSVSNGMIFQIYDPLGYLTPSPLILAARYSEKGQMKELIIGERTGTELCFSRPLALGAKWKIFFLHPETYAPLCPAISL